MNNFEQATTRWHFVFPEDYLTFYNTGMLTESPATGLRLSRFWWLTPAEIAGCDWPDYKIPELVPFAKTPGRDHFCWHKDGGWVASCPRDSDFGEGFAPSFAGFVYRALLEEFAGTWLVSVLESDSAKVRTLLAEYSARAGALLPESWRDVLRDCGKRELIQTEWDHQSIRSEEMNVIVQRDLAFPMLNRSFKQHMD